MQYISEYMSPLGIITIACNEHALTGLWFNGQKNFAGTLSSCHKTLKTPLIKQTSRWLDIYFNGDIPDFMPPVKLIGTPFRLSVWHIVEHIPYGNTLSYGNIAQMLSIQTDTPNISARAVGTAVGHNPVSIIVPCHRVVGSSGNLTGYAAGINKKAELLKIENILF